MTYSIKPAPKWDLAPRNAGGPVTYAFDVFKDGEAPYSVAIKPPKGRAWDVPIMLETVYRAAFSPQMNGYPGLFIGGGYLLCYECGIQSLSTIGDNDEELEYVIDWSYQDNLSGHTCDACEAWIYEPHCGNCMKEQSELERPLLYNSSGDRCVCRDCIVDGLNRSHHIGDQRLLPGRIFAERLAADVYDVTNTWFDGIYGDGQAVCDYIKASPRAW